MIQDVNCQEESQYLNPFVNPIVNPIVILERPLEMILRKGESIAIKCHNNFGDNDNGFYKINLPFYGGGSPEEWLMWKYKLLKALNDQSISKGSQMYTFTERLSTGEARASFD